MKKRRRRKEGRGGPKSLVEQGCFNHGGVSLYIAIQGSFRQKNKVEQKHQRLPHGKETQVLYIVSRVTLEILGQTDWK